MRSSGCRPIRFATGYLQVVAPDLCTRTFKLCVSMCDVNIVRQMVFGGGPPFFYVHRGRPRNFWTGHGRSKPNNKADYLATYLYVAQQGGLLPVFMYY